MEAEIGRRKSPGYFAVASTMREESTQSSRVDWSRARACVSACVHAQETLNRGRRERERERRTCTYVACTYIAVYKREEPA